MRIYNNFDLTNYNSYKITSKCRYAYFPDCEEDVIRFFETFDEFILLGSGHNIILSNEYYDKPFLIFNGNFNSINLINDELLEVNAGSMMSDVAKFALDNSLLGLEIFWDIPSSLGGAVVMNAGASGEEIKDVLVKVRYLDLTDNKVKEISKADISFEYRNSFFQRNTNKIVLNAWLKLRKGNHDQIRSKMESIKLARWTKQPREFPNAGSVFKRPKGFYVGALMDELGLKGYGIGGAEFSLKHGGFIINKGEATGRDIIKLINHAKNMVLEKYGIELETEQRII